MTPSEKADVNLKLTDEVPGAQDSADLEKIRFPDLLIVLAKRKSFLFKFIGSAIVLSTGISFLLPKTYTANTKIMPPQQNQSMAAMAALNQLGPLASLAGQGLGLRNPSDVYVAMLHSDTVANSLVDKFSLMKVYGKKLHVDARRHLETLTEIRIAREGVISISVEDRNPQLAADLANGYVEELENLTRVLAVTEAGKRRIFFEHEVRMASDELANAEGALKQTQEKTGLILLDSQSRAIIESLTSLRAKMAAQEVQVQMMRTFATAENPDLIRAEQELTALNDQLNRLERGRSNRSFGDVPIENVPTAGLEYVRRLREVRYRETLFELLAKQYEAAKIDEARDALIVQQLDKAAPPERKSGPLRAAIISITIVSALLVGILVAFLSESLQQAKEDPQYAARLQLFKYYLLGGRR